MSALAATHVSATQRYRTLFDERMQGTDALAQLRHAALERFIAAGFPTQRQEDWKYTSLRRLESRDFTLGEVAPSAANTGWIAGASCRIVLINGHVIASLSNASPQPPGVTVLTLGQWIANDPAAVAQFLDQRATADETAFGALNTAFVRDGVVIDIADGVSFDQPIYVVHQWTPGSQPAMSHPKIFVRAGHNSRCTLIEHYLGSNDTESFTNAAVSIDVQSGARITHYRLQQESTRGFHIASVHARLDRDSHYRCQDFAFGAGLARTSITASLQGPGAEADLRGLFAPDGSQHLDTYTLVDHVAPRTLSSEEYRGIAAGRGRGVYRGKVIVRQDAQKIDSRQSSRNLLLSPTAQIDTRPELEIYAHDVKCSHGATTGQLDATALFYLRSRGLSEPQARALLIQAFAESILTRIDCVPVRQYLEQRLHERFAGNEVAS